MTTPDINYGELMQRALRGVMADALSIVEERGLPGEHHFYVTYDTRHESVALPDWLRAEYPEQITIVLQFEFSNLRVGEDGFSVTMSFSNKPADLYIPFDAVLTFVDPSVEFGLKFEATEPLVEDEPLEEEEPKQEASEGADVVSLDQFRKT